MIYAFPSHFHLFTSGSPAPQPHPPPLLQIYPKECLPKLLIMTDVDAVLILSWLLPGRTVYRFSEPYQHSPPTPPSPETPGPLDPSLLLSFSLFYINSPLCFSLCSHSRPSLLYCFADYLFINFSYILIINKYIKSCIYT